MGKLGKNDQLFAFTPPERHSLPRSLAEAARRLGMKQRTLENWKADGLIQPRRDGRWSTRSITAVAEGKITEAEERLMKDDGSRSPWLEEFRRLRCEREQLTLDRDRGEVLERVEVERRENEIALTFKNALLGLSREMAPHLFGREIPEIEGALRERLENILRGLSGQNAG